jgi:hypothetical protein
VEAYVLECAVHPEDVRNAEGDASKLMRVIPMRALDDPELGTVYEGRSE